MSALALLKDPVAREMIRRKCEDDLLFFTKFFFTVMTNKKFILNYHHREIADHLHACARGDILRLIINMPPRYTKTEIAVINFVPWALAKNPAAKFIHLSFSDPLVQDNSSRIKRIINSEEYRLLWPDVQIDKAEDSKKKWATTAGGGLYAVSSGGAVTGFGAGSTASGNDSSVEEWALDIIRQHGIDVSSFENRAIDDKFYGAILIDDPLKPEAAGSDRIRTSINERMTNTIGSRVNSSRTPIIVIMQRLHEDDTTGFLLGNKGTGEKWHQLKFEALIENDDGSYRALWPFRHTVQKLLEMRKSSSYVFAGQYQQTPTPAGGGIIKLSWFGRYREQRADYEQIIFSCDTAYKEQEHNDPSVISVFGKHDGQWHLVEVWRERVQYPDLLTHAEKMIARWRPSALLVEDKASGQSLIQDLRRKGHPVIKIQPEGSKLVRMSVESPQLEAGLIVLPEQADWLYELEKEFINFPKSKHDDQVDTLSQFLCWLRKGAISANQDIVIELPDTDDNYYEDDF